MHIKDLMKKFAPTVDGDVTNLETGGGDGEATKEPTVAELKAQMDSLQKTNAAMAKEREQLLQMAANVDKVVEERTRVRQAGGKAPEDDEEQDDEETKRVVQRVTRRVSKENAPMMNALATMQDQLDGMQFRQLAAEMGETAESVIEVEKEYSKMRQGGAVIKWGDGREAPLTRLDVLDLRLGREGRATKLKDAPTKQMENLRTRVLGNAQFENPGGERRTVPGLQLDQKFENKDNKSKVTELEKALSDVPLM